MYLEASGRDIWSGHPAKGGYKLEVLEEYFAFLLGTQSALEVTNINSVTIVSASAYYILPEVLDSIATGSTFLVLKDDNIDVNYRYNFEPHILCGPPRESFTDC